MQPTFTINVDSLIHLALEEDLGEHGDVTSRATLPSKQRSFARMIAKSRGVVAGLPVVRRVFEHIDPGVMISNKVQDGTLVEPGTVIAELMGEVRSLLAGERTALNFIQRLSGIASLTSRYVEAVKGTNAVILDTRKTTPGWRLLEKYAVRMGGGQNHRIGLYDMVMVKDNHIDAAGGIVQAVKSVRAEPSAAGLAIEVEVRTLNELRVALSLNVNRIMLDNMDEKMMREAVRIADGQVPLEASGNMTLERVRAVAETGVNFISVGALTHSAPSLDISMKIVKESRNDST
ncbi:MAG: carboxylating nicotinate-nucleotide diphosphorylase [Chloroflexota bacterium]|nr:carboxylating nicotinate-nucleotide diphosphorylase [Chloroflexota bacterium]